MLNPSLQYLILDPTYGYLYPHRHAIAAFGLPNEYQLAKHRPHLIEGQHWHKIRGTDQIDRIFYTLPGLEFLTRLIGTSQAQAFWYSIIQQTQPGGALVPLQPAVLYTEPEPITPIVEPQLLLEPTLYRDPIPVGRNTPPYAFTQSLSPEVQRIVQQALPPATTSATPSATLLSLTPQETAALIFRAQEVVGDQIAKTQATHRSSITIWQRADSWLATQDSTALAIIYSLIILLLGISSYFLMSAMVRSNSLNYNPSTQSTWR